MGPAASTYRKHHSCSSRERGSQASAERACGLRRKAGQITGDTQDGRRSGAVCLCHLRSRSQTGRAGRRIPRHWQCDDGADSTRD